MRLWVIWLTCLGGFFSGWVTTAASALVEVPGLEKSSSTRKSHPNVLVVITDDQGYGDLSCHGNPVIRTPNMDALAAQSIRLTNFHVAPMCTPTRGQLMSGKDAFRNGAMNVSSGRTMLRPELKTIADVFKDAGYRTGMFGKWHLGDNHPFRPIDRGFQQALRFPSSHINAVPDYWNNDYFDDTYTRDSVIDGVAPENSGTLGKRESIPGYCTDVFFRESLQWMTQDSEQPFFCYLALNAPHWPHFVPEADRLAVEQRMLQHPEVASQLDDGPRSQLMRFLAMIECIDRNLGEAIAGLEEAGLREDTVLVFLTDNGSTMGPKYYNARMRGGKTRLWEGGHRVPCFLSWPAAGLQNREIEGLCHVQDIFPTLTSLAGVSGTPENLDGIDLSPVLQGSQAMPERKLVINYSRMPTFRERYTKQPHLPNKDGAAVLWKQWRWIENRELYNLADDPMQEHDVAEQFPEVAAELRQHLDRWWEEVEPLVNQPQKVIIGSRAENPSMLTACEWLDVFVDQQVQIRAGVPKFGAWHLLVARPGRYRIEARRWPRESKLALARGIPATQVTGGTYRPGKALPIHAGQLMLDDQPMAIAPQASPEALTWEVELPAGPLKLQADFLDADGKPVCGAYYVYVERLD